ncbi:hypothetical protein ABIC89_002402 [Variovorax boronicumulans]
MHRHARAPQSIKHFRLLHFCWRTARLSIEVLSLLQRRMIRASTNGFSSSAVRVGLPIT